MMRPRWKSLGVALTAATALLALFAVPAQAANLENGGTAGRFRVAGLSTLVAGTTFTGTQVGSGTLLILGKNAFIKCSTGKITEGAGINESEAKATVLFEGCKFFEDAGSFPELSACKIKEEMITARVLAKAKLHEGELYVLLEGSGAEQLVATVEIANEECLLGINPKIKGSIVGKVINGSVEEIEHLIEFSKAITELFQVVSGGVTKGDILKFGTAQALVTGAGIVKLTGAHLGLKWSVI